MKKLMFFFAFMVIVPVMNVFSQGLVIQGKWS